jgi:hypothetical protein
VFACVLAHVYEFGGLLDGQKRSLNDRFGFADKGDDCPIGGFSRIYVEEFYAFYAFDSIGNLLDDGHVAPLGEIGDTFDELFHGAKVLISILFGKVLMCDGADRHCTLSLALLKKMLTLHNIPVYSSIKTAKSLQV